MLQGINGQMVNKMTCPITHAPIKHPVTIHDRFVFECDAILEWLKYYSLVNPYTNEPLEPDWAWNILKTNDAAARLKIQSAGYLMGGRVSFYVIFMLAMLKTAALQPFNLIKHRVRMVIRTYEFLIRALMVFLMSLLATCCFVLTVVSLLMILKGYFDYTLPMLGSLFMVAITLSQIRNSIDVLIELISTFLYYIVPLLIMTMLFKAMLHFNCVNRPMLKILLWFVPPIMVDAIESKNKSNLFV